jgi:murein L,D-transpeptidase YcbB/YkuD
MDIPPISNRGEKYLKEHEKDPRPLKLITYQEVSPRVPIYIIYQTAYPTPTTNKVELWPDIYGYDKVIEREMKQYLIK